MYWSRVKCSYRRLGLAARPLAIYSSGGVEKTQNTVQAVEGGQKSIKPRRSEARIQRHLDGTTSVVYPDSDDEEHVTEQPSLHEETPVVKGIFKYGILLIIELMEIASKPQLPNLRQSSTLEAQWLQKLVDTYGDNYDRMMWDKELNPMQHTVAQLKRKIKTWKQTTLAN